MHLLMSHLLSHILIRFLCATITNKIFQAAQNYFHLKECKIPFLQPLIFCFTSSKRPTDSTLCDYTSLEILTLVSNAIYFRTTLPMYIMVTPFFSKAEKSLLPLCAHSILIIVYTDSLLSVCQRFLHKGVFIFLT